MKLKIVKKILLELLYVDMNLQKSGSAKKNYAPPESASESLTLFCSNHVRLRGGVGRDREYEAAAGLLSPILNKSLELPPYK